MSSPRVAEGNGDWNEIELTCPPMILWTMETVNAIDDSKVPLQAAGRVVGDSKSAKVATRAVLTGALLWPIAPVGLLHGFKRGENAYLAQGRRFRFTVSVDTKIMLSRIR